MLDLPLMEKQRVGRFHNTRRKYKKYIIAEKGYAHGNRAG